MRRAPVTREQAQSFDQVAADYDRLGELGAITGGDSWLAELLPPAGAMSATGRLTCTTWPQRGSTTSFSAC
jgi:hypothetical protein